jgi:sec-independent protein translocase protein TatA
MDIGPSELIIVLIIVLLIFGPGRIAKLGRELGSGIRNFRQGMETPPESDEDKKENEEKGEEEEKKDSQE